MKPFYLVWSEGRGNPTSKHESYANAEREAHRLAKLNPGEEFHVLVSSCTLHIPDPVIKTEHLEDMPF